MTESKPKTEWWVPPIEAYLLPLASFVAMVISIQFQFEDAGLDNILFGMIFLAIPLLILGVIGFACGKFAAPPISRYALFVWLLLLSISLGSWVGRAIGF